MLETLLCLRAFESSRLLPTHCFYSIRVSIITDIMTKERCLDVELFDQESVASVRGIMLQTVRSLQAIFIALAESLECQIKHIKVFTERSSKFCCI